MADSFQAELYKYKDLNKYDASGKTIKTKNASVKGGNFAFLIVLFLIPLGAMSPIFSSTGRIIFRYMLFLSIPVIFYLYKKNKSTKSQS